MNLTTRTIILLSCIFCWPALAQVHYDVHDTLRLATGATRLVVTDNVTGAKSVVPFVLPVGATRVVVRGTYHYDIDLPGEQTVDCADTAGTCQISMRRTWGKLKLKAWYVNDADTQIGSTFDLYLPSVGVKQTGTILMPITVLGHGYNEQIAEVTVPAGADVSGTISLWMRLFNVKRDGMGSVQVNNSSWYPITEGTTTGTVTFLDQCKEWGKWNGGCTTLRVAMPLPAGTVKVGANIVRFRQNASDSVTAGYRVLAFNFSRPAITLASVTDSGNTATADTGGAAHGLAVGQEFMLYGVRGDGAKGPLGLNGLKTVASVPSSSTFTYASSGVRDGAYDGTGRVFGTVTNIRVSRPITARRFLVPASAFEEEDPNDSPRFTTPSTDPADIEAGRQIFAEGTGVAMFAPGAQVQLTNSKCGSCHISNGYDLKYFSFPDDAILMQGPFHGFNETQANQLLSYIRSNSASYEGRVWNPPYQPAPGLDAQPLNKWAAGAGLDWVLDDDLDMLPYIFPNDMNSADLTATGTPDNINAREVPVNTPYPIWFRWLPAIYPGEQWPEFQTSEGRTRFDTLKAALTANSSSSLAAQQNNINVWGVRVSDFLYAKIPPTNDASWNTDTVVKGTLYHSVARWRLTKLFELLHTKQLEGFGTQVLGTQADARSWTGDNGWPFWNSPNMVRIPPTAPNNSAQGTLLNGMAPITHNIESHVWYPVQLSLNYGQKRQTANNPIDWSYVHGFIASIGQYSGLGSVGTEMLWANKGMRSVTPVAGLGATRVQGATTLPALPARFDISVPFYLADLDHRGIVTGYNVPTNANYTDETQNLFKFMLSRYVPAWTAWTASWTAQQWQDYGNTWALTWTPTNNNNPMGKYFWDSVPLLRWQGVTSAAIDAYVEWLKDFMPAVGDAEWDAHKAHQCCRNSSGYQACQYNIGFTGTLSGCLAGTTR